MKLGGRKCYAMPEFSPMEIDDFAVEANELDTTVVMLTDGRTEPVLIVDERDTVDAPTVLFAQAWSAGIEQPYQKVKSATLAHELGIRAVTPNTFGMAVDSPRLTRVERRALRNGNAASVGRLSVLSAFEAMDIEGQDIPTSVDIVAASQGPLLVPGMLAELRNQNVQVDTVNLFTPASNRIGGRAWHLPGLMRDMLTNAPKRMKEYRAENPHYLSTEYAKDTNIVRSLMTQARAHLWTYPMAMIRQNLALQIANAYRGAESAPKVNVFAAEHDKVSSLKRNERLVMELNRLGICAELHVLEDQHHAVTEHVPYIAHLLRPIIRPDTI